MKRHVVLTRAGAAAACALLSSCSGEGVVVPPAPEVTTVVVALAQPTLKRGASTQATARVLDQRGDPITGRVVTWSSPEPAVVIVDDGGLVTAVAAGTSVIKAAAGGKVGEATDQRWLS